MQIRNPKTENGNIRRAEGKKGKSVKELHRVVQLRVNKCLKLEHATQAAQPEGRHTNTNHGS